MWRGLGAGFVMGAESPGREPGRGAGRGMMMVTREGEGPLVGRGKPGGSLGAGAPGRPNTAWPLREALLGSPRAALRGCKGKGSHVGTEGGKWAVSVRTRREGPKELPTGKGGPAWVGLKLNCIVPSHTHLPAMSVSGRSGGTGWDWVRDRGSESASQPTPSSGPQAPAAPPTVPRMPQRLETQPADKTALSRDIA